MMDFLASLEQMKFSIWVLSSGSVWAYPTILTVHTFGMSIVAGIAALLSMRLLGVSPQTKLAPLDRVYPWMWWAFGINALTGSILMIADATTKLANPDFYIKLVFVFAGVGLLKMIRKSVFSNPNADSMPLPSNAKMLAWANIFCWFAAITAGRLLAYVGPVSGLNSPR